MMRLAGKVQTGILPAAFLSFFCYAVLLIFSSVLLPFPSGVDEAEHLAVIKQQHISPALFPDYSTYQMLESPEYTRLGEQPNYINHPSLYYLLMAPFYGDGGEGAVLRLRLLNALLAMTAMALMMRGALHLCAKTAEKHMVVLLLVLLPLFPKAPVGGAINNDSLALLAAGCVFYGLSASSRRTGWLVAGVLLAGWAKLTALIMLGGALWIWRALAWCDGEARKITREDIWLLLASLGASIPYLVNFSRWGTLQWFNHAYFFVPEVERPDLSFGMFVELFFSQFAMKWQVAEGMLPMVLVLLMLVVPVIFGLYGRMMAERRIAIAFCSAFLLTLCIHIGFGWQMYQQIGDLTISQARYYSILWPGVALALCLAMQKLSFQKWGCAFILALVLWPTAWSAPLLAALR